ncbi:unnamed protein product [Paramecium octaurelia]|uniref:Uncharacterized protein n=1 Tax=Paramecium octaurelia TaxID=43137 RepID=A0A8S1T7H2_PAROT|nr:unnamed protein product [Paramecium octaurelia]
MLIQKSANFHNNIIHETKISKTQKILDQKSLVQAIRNEKFLSFIKTENLEKQFLLNLSTDYKNTIWF